MKKQMIIGLSVLVVAIIGGTIYYLNTQNRVLSPPGSEKLSNQGLSVSVNYNRPSVRGRVIFGTKSEGALQPYGEYWRLGANEATEFTFNRDVQFNGQPLKAGTYRVYAFPGENEFEIAMNSELGKWGAYNPDALLDVLHTKVPVEKLSTPVEQFTIQMKSADSGIDIIFEWEKVRFVVPVR